MLHQLFSGSLPATSNILCPISEHSVDISNCTHTPDLLVCLQASKTQTQQWVLMAKSANIFQGLESLFTFPSTYYAKKIFFSSRRPLEIGRNSSS